MSKQKHQILLRVQDKGGVWFIRRDDGEYRYRLEGDGSFGEFGYDCSLPLLQQDVAHLFC